MEQEERKTDVQGGAKNVRCSKCGRTSAFVSQDIGRWCDAKRPDGSSCDGIMFLDEPNPFTGDLIDRLTQDVLYTDGMLRSAIDQYAAAHDRLGSAKEALLLQRQQVIREHRDDMKALGSNEAAREAAIADITFDAADRVRSCEAEAFAATCLLDQAKVGRESLDMKLRVLEIASRRS